MSRFLKNLKKLGKDLKEDFEEAVEDAMDKAGPTVNKAVERTKEAGEKVSRKAGEIAGEIRQKSIEQQYGRVEKQPEEKAEDDTADSGVNVTEHIQQVKNLFANGHVENAQDGASFLFAHIEETGGTLENVKLAPIVDMVTDLYKTGENKSADAAKQWVDTLIDKGADTKDINPGAIKKFAPMLRLDGETEAAAAVTKWGEHLESKLGIDSAPQAGSRRRRGRGGPK